MEEGWEEAVEGEDEESYSESNRLSASHSIIERLLGSGLVLTLGDEMVSNS